MGPSKTCKDLKGEKQAVQIADFREVDFELEATIVSTIKS